MLREDISGMFAFSLGQGLTMHAAVIVVCAFIHNAALAGFGLAYLPEDQVRTQLDNRRVIRGPLFSGYHLYYPSRRQAPPAFALLLGALRYRGWSRKIRHRHHRRC